MQTLAGSKPLFRQNNQFLDLKLGNLTRKRPFFLTSHADMRYIFCKRLQEAWEEKDRRVD
jgi:hypothetical protein